jgi:ATP-dependent RNA helicase DHX57
MEKMSTEWLDIIETGEGGVIYEMVSFLQDNLDEIMNHPPPAQEVFRFLRPQADDIDALNSGTRIMKIDKGKQARRDGGHPLPAGDSKTLLQQFDSLKQTSSYQTLLRKRQTLPAFSSRSALIKLIQDNRVVIVSGATGSGKTTQVPTFVLENAIESLKGKETNIIVTQPRRISAIGVATRVAQERCEDQVGKEGTMVGYAIRGERKASRHCRLLFCTTGIRELVFCVFFRKDLFLQL